jgi:outer membrane phospholipase A
MVDHIHLNKAFNIFPSKDNKKCLVNLLFMVIVYTFKGNNYFKCTNNKESYFQLTNYSPHLFIGCKHNKDDFPIFFLHWPNIVFQLLINQQAS